MPGVCGSYVSPGRAFQPEGQKTASRMENLSVRSVTKKGNSIRKAFFRA